MAKYIVEESYKKTYEKNYKLPFINLIPAFVWNIPIHQKLYPDASFWITLGIGAAFIALYIYLSMKPIIAAVPCIAGIVILTALFWAPADYIGNNVVRIIVKGVILVVAIMIELCVWINATLPWLESKEANKPRIRVEK